jgi:tyrosyl-tRNA synthetase
MNFKSEFSSNFLREFKERGFFALATHEKELDSALAKGAITAYIGFDCTAKSLHAGSLIQIMILRLLQKHGHKPLVLLGGGTTKIGDPSGKDEARQVLTPEKIQENLNGIRKTLEKFISFEGNNAATLVNNDDWLKNLNYLEFLRDVGRYFSINRMLTFDSVKTRLEREQPLSFLEFNYMILQAYDFYELNHKYGCSLQIGGSDQWGNIVNGVELIRRKSAETLSKKIVDKATLKTEIHQDEDFSDEGRNFILGTNAFGLTSPLLTTADGKKMGKSADGAVWLDAEMLSPFDYFQYFRNTHDKDVGKFLRLFTDLEIAEIENLEKLKDQEINKAKEVLAFEVVKICHGENVANEVLQKAREIFVSKSSAAFEIKEVSLSDEGKKLIEIMKEIGAVESNGEAKKLIEGKAVKINGEAVIDVKLSFKEAAEFDLSVGKKKFFKIVIK